MNTTRSRTQLGPPGPRPLGGSPAPRMEASAPMGMDGVKLGSLRELRGEVAGMSRLVDRMADEMAGLRAAVETMVAGNAQAAEPPRPTGARSAREAALEARVEALERRVGKLRKRLER